MQFRIADTFTDSLAKLTNQEQKAVKTTAFDLQLNPASPGIKFHRLERARDANFWSVRVNRDIRIIVHRTASSIMLCYTDHHDKAYGWAERRKIERHPKTGAAQLIQIPERVGHEALDDYNIAAAPPSEPTSPPLFTDQTDDELLGFGVPAEWLPEVRAATEDTLLDLADHLPPEASEALLDLATGVTPRPAPARPAAEDLFAHPDAQRRFRLLANVEELERALEFPWEKWTVFLHPAQRALAERAHNGPARIAGSAGTGKTVVALHRAVHLARRHPEAKILLTTFSRTLAIALKTKLDRLAGNEPNVVGRIGVHSIEDIAREMYEAAFGEPKLASRDRIRALLAEAAETAGAEFSERFLFNEWTDVVDAWQLETWEDYRDVARLGRKTRIGGKQREALWTVFDAVRSQLAARGEITWAQLFGRLTDRIEATGDRPFDFAVVDEAQDLGVAPLRFLAAIGSGRPDGLFFAGDLGQRIFQTPFSWKALGIDVRGRSHTLRINYRTSHQIRAQADRLLPRSIADVDGIVEDRRGAKSVFNGPPPEIHICADSEGETETVAAWISQRLGENFQPHEIGLFVRSGHEIERAKAAAKGAEASFVILDDGIETAAGKIAIGTMHLAKGLEFRAVAVLACDDDILPLQERIESITDESDLEEVYDTERHLLYVACTRARDRLLVTGVDPASEFLADLRG